MVLTIAVIALFIIADNATELSTFRIALIGGVIVLVPLAFLLYRAYALNSLTYTLTRSGLELKWGLRKELVPLNNIEWVRPVDEMGFHIPVPMMSLPGVLFGSRHIENLGRVEYLASRLHQALVVGTQDAVFIISPENPKRFLSTFTTINEMGSLDALNQLSVKPRTLLSNIWQDRIARWLFLASAASLLILLGLSTILVSRTNSITWFDGEQVPSVRLYLLPVLNGLFWLVDLVVGVFFYLRDDEAHLPTYILWGTASLSSILFIVALIGL